MQAQCTSTTTHALTSAQSLAAVQTLLRAGLGCIAYVRNLLPADNFSQSHFTSEDDSVTTASSEIPGGSSKLAVNGFKIMTMSRGYTEEADKILNYLEHGIFDALEKQYLRSFIFGIYLDSKDPTNIVEAYTFNFQYYKVPGGNSVIPIMSLDEGIKKLTLSGRDPLTESVKTGKPPTIRDVKRSVKRLLKTLIHSTNNMEALPKRRFATFKVFYTDITPADYEPPNFRPGDHFKDKWYFMTHDLDEVPEKWSLGSVETGHHSVDVNVRSVVSFLPSSTDNDDAPFTGTISIGQGVPKLTPVQEANVRVIEAENQLKDAEHRNIAWNVDNMEDDKDADGEDDPDYAKGADGNYVKITRSSPVFVNKNVPAGIRDQDGNIVPIIRPVGAVGDSMELDEAHFGGLSEEVPSHVGQLKPDNQPHHTQTQPLEQTQSIHNPALLFTPTQQSPSMTRVPLEDVASPGSFESTPTPITKSTGSICPDSDMGSISKGETQIFAETSAAQHMTDDTEMLDMETQVISVESCDTIESFKSNARGDKENMFVTPRKGGPMDNGLKCNCGILVEDDHLCFCEGRCNSWYHVWCMGYHSGTDDRFPTKFICFDCRVRADPNWDLLAVELYPRMISNFRELATFRRAIKIAETLDVESERDFVKAMECDNDHGHQLFKRLQDEDIVCQQITTVDELGLVETQSRNVRGKARGKGKGRARQTKRSLKPKYAFNKAFPKSKEYSDYFDPDPKVERKMLNLPQLDDAFSARARLGLFSHAASSTQDLASQTQDTSPIAFPNGMNTSKRGHLGQGDARLAKKIKISLATGVDLAE